jgi:cold shock CspA family protein
MAETFNKKEKEKKRLQKRQEKEMKKQERKANAKEGQSLEDMMAYVDEYGNISSTPPDPAKKMSIKESDIVIGSRNQAGFEPVAVIRKGRVAFFNTAKGYGFIKDIQTQESIFVHMNALTAPVKENDKVTFEVEMTVKGLSAIRVKIV